MNTYLVTYTFRQHVGRGFKTADKVTVETVAQWERELLSEGREEGFLIDRIAITGFFKLDE